MQSTASELAIIGAGPIGIEIAVALKKAGIDYLHFDAKQIGFTISWFAPETRFFSSNERIAIAGVPLATPDQTKCTREQYLAYLRTVVTLFDLKINTYQPVTKIDRDGSAFRLSTRRGGSEAEYRVKKLILATGGAARPRRLGVPGENLPHVTSYFQDPHEYFRKNLLIIGGRNSAVEAMLRSHHCGANVSVSYRRENFDAASIKYWLWPELNGLVQSGCIKTYMSSTVREIRPNGVVMTLPDGKTIEAPADFVLLLIGYEADMTLCKMAGAELRQPGDLPTFNPQTMETNVPGLFIAGTAVAGTQSKYSVFIENCHVHADRIIASLTGARPPQFPQANEQPES
jgi:thioredoxin reductase (NADPH)